MAGVAAHVFVADLDEPALNAADEHHLGRVLRLRDGEIVTASDGAGGLLRCSAVRVGEGLRLEPAGDVERVPAATPAVTVGFALTKGEKPEWAVQRLTEVGVDRIVPFVAARSVVRWDPARAARHTDRLRSVARAAAMQSRRLWLPEVSDPAPFHDVLAGLGGLGDSSTGVGARAALADPSGEAPSLDRPAILVGPEGGFDDAELASGLARVRLGDHVLRAETAAVTAGVLLCALRGDLVWERR